MTVVFVVSLSLGLIAYNAALNLVPFPRWSYVPLNLALAAGLLAVARARGLGWEALGLSPGQLAAGLRWGLGTVAVVAVAVTIGTVAGDRLPAVERLLADQRAVGLSGLGLAYETMIRIPLGTALFEEVAFRGVLFAAVAERGTPATAVIVSSVVFGLWHIGPGLVTLRLNEPALSVAGQILGVAAMVGVTTAAGVFLCWLRIASGGLLAPVIAHWAANALGLAAAARTQRPG